MRLALVHPGEYPEGVRAELAQLVSVLQTAFSVEHDTNDRQRTIWQRWNLGEDLSVTTGTETIIPMRRPDILSSGDIEMDQVGGSATIKTPGIYLVTAQLRWTANATGARTVAIYRNRARRARCQAITAVSDTQITVTETFPCESGTTIYMTGTQTSGGGLAVVASSGTSNESFLTIARVA